MRFTRRGKTGLVVLSLLLMLLWPVAGAVAEPGTAEASGAGPDIELTLAQAVEMALEHDLGLRKLDIDLRLSREAEEEAREGFYEAQYLLAADNGYYVYIPGDKTSAAAESAYYGYLKAQASTEMQEKEVQVAADKVVLDAHQRYFDVLQAQQAVNAAEATAARAEAEAEAARARFQVGMVSYLELMQAEQELLDARKGLGNAQAALEQAYRSLADLLGLPSTARPVLAEKVGFSALEPIEDIDAYTRSVLAADPVLWQLQRGVDLQKTLSRQYGTDEEQAELTIEQARLNEKDYRQQMALAVPRMYDAIMQLERQYKVLEKALVTARESLRLAELSYRLGMATQADVLAAKAGVAGAEGALLQVAVQHSLAKLKLAKPWTGTTGAGTGA